MRFLQKGSMSNSDKSAYLPHLRQDVSCRVEVIICLGQLLLGLVLPSDVFENFKSASLLTGWLLLIWVITWWRPAKNTELSNWSIFIWLWGFTCLLDFNRDWINQTFSNRLTLIIPLLRGWSVILYLRACIQQVERTYLPSDLGDASSQIGGGTILACCWRQKHFQHVFLQKVINLSRKDVVEVRGSLSLLLLLRLLSTTGIHNRFAISRLSRIWLYLLSLSVVELARILFVLFNWSLELTFVKFLLFLWSWRVVRVFFPVRGACLTRSISFRELIIPVRKQTSVPVSALALFLPILTHFIFKTLGWRAIIRGWRRCFRLILNFDWRLRRLLLGLILTAWRCALCPLHLLRWTTIATLRNRLIQGSRVVIFTGGATITARLFNVFSLFGVLVLPFHELLRPLLLVKIKSLQLLMHYSLLLLHMVQLLLSVLLRHHELLLFGVCAWVEHIDNVWLEVRAHYVQLGWSFTLHRLLIHVKKRILIDLLRLRGALIVLMFSVVVPLIVVLKRYCVVIEVEWLWVGT